MIDLMFRNERLTTNDLYVDRDKCYVPESRHPFFTSPSSAEQNSAWMVILASTVALCVGYMLFTELTGRNPDAVAGAIMLGGLACLLASSVGKIIR